MSSVTMNGPAFLLRQTLAKSLMAGMTTSDFFIADREQRKRALGLDQMTNGKAVDLTEIEVGRRKGDRHVPFLAQAARELRMQDRRARDGKHGLRGIAVLRDHFGDDRRFVRMTRLDGQRLAFA